MANIGYRTFGGGTDKVDVNLGNIASQTSLDCWIFAGRLTDNNNSGNDGEIIHTASYDPIDWYYIRGTGRIALYDGANDTAGEAGGGGVTWSSADGFVIFAFRRVSSTVVRWSKAVYSGGSWGAFTHSNGTTVFGSRSYPSSGVLEIGNTNPLNMDVALIARCTSATDSDINGLTANLAAWQALGSLTNLWRFDGAGGANAVNDLKGTASQNAISGTSVTAAGFPLDAGTAAVTGSIARTLDAVIPAISGTATSSTVSGSIAVTVPAVTAAISATVTPPPVSGTIAATLPSVTPAITATFGTFILNDGFPGSAINSGLWDVYNRCGDLVNSEVNAVIPANVRVGSGTLKIDSKFEDVFIGDSETAPTTYHYTSGQIAQRGAPFLYGTVEVRAKIPGGTGTWPCIWMLGERWQLSQPDTANTPGHDWPNGGWWEIDIAEFMSGHRTLQNCALHFITASRGGSGEKSIPFDATTRFMVYRLEWAATSLTWMIDAEDGVGWRTLLTITGTAGTDIPNTPGYLIIHTAIGGVGGTPDSSTYPVTMEVDYARITLGSSSPDNATIDVELPAATSSISATATPPGVSGSIARTLDAVTPAISGTATPPAVSGTITATLPAVTSSTSGTVTPPPVSGTIAATLPAVTSSLAGSFIPAPVSGTITVTVDAVAATMTGGAAPPGTSGSIAVTLNPAVSSITATATVPAATGTISAILPPVVPAIAAVAVAPPATGTIAVTVGSVAAHVSGTVSNGTVVIVAFGPVTTTPAAALGPVTRTPAATLGPVEVTP